MLRGGSLYRPCFNRIKKREREEENKEFLGSTEGTILKVYTHKT
jgi:hypothetical protein